MHEYIDYGWAHPIRTAVVSAPTIRGIRPLAGDYTQAARGRRVTDDSFVLCFNAHDEPIDFTLRPADFGEAWLPVLNTADLVPPIVGPTPIKAGATVRVQARATTVLQAASPG
jgi:hypothetical protein